ncbi:hypothetical protein NMG60_11037236 [Bertholletia excelsa]
MAETQSNLSTKKRSKTKTTTKTSLRLKTSSSPPTKQKTMYKSSNISTTIPENMDAKTPVEIGTKGTVGSLVMKEIEYFSQLGLGPPIITEKPQNQLTDVASTSSYTTPKIRSLITNPKKKKRGGSKLIPSMCSIVKVAKTNQSDVSAGFSYRNLKADAKKLQS